MLLFLVKQQRGCSLVKQKRGCLLVEQQRGCFWSENNVVLFNQATTWLSLVKQQRGGTWSCNRVGVPWLRNSVVVLC